MLRTGGMPPAGSICIRPFSKLGGKDVTIGVDHLNRGCSIYLNSEDSASNAVLIDQHELCGAHERFGSVVLALTASTPVGEFLAPQA